MAGLDYFPANSNFFEDDKIGVIESEFGIAGGYFAFRLLCKVYNMEGYFSKWNDEVAKLMERRVAREVAAKKINEIVFRLAELDMFDLGMLQKYGIITSRGIQRRYLDGKKRTQSVEMRREYVLIMEDIKKYSNLTLVGDYPESPVEPAAASEDQQTGPAQHERSADDGQPAVSTEPQEPVQQPQRRLRKGYHPEQRADATLEQVEEDKLIQIFFFNNFVKPNEEYQKFKNWNNLHHMDSGGWDAMPVSARQSAAIGWKQDPEQKRFPKFFLDMWQDAYGVLSRPETPFVVLHDMLRDDITWSDDVVGMGSDTRYTYTITCTKTVADYLSTNKALLPETMRKLLSEKTLKFKTCS